MPVESKPANNDIQQTPAPAVDKAINKTEAEQSEKENSQDPSKEIDKRPPVSNISVSDFLSKYKKNN